MKVAAFCPIGIEDILEKDILNIIKINPEKRNGCCLVECNEQEFVKLAYLCQSAERIGLLINNGKIIDNDLSSINIDNCDFSNIKEKFSVNARVHNMPFKSTEVVMEISEKIKEKTGKIPLYKNADTSYYCYLFDQEYYIIIDVASKELTKRDYKVFVNKVSLRGTIAYAVSQIANIKENDIVLDPFNRGGEIIIELVHKLINKSIHYYTKDKFNFNQIGINASFDDIDKEINESIKSVVYSTDERMPNIKAAEKNAKIAGINKLIIFSRLNIDDLDFKFNNNVDKVITHLPAAGNHNENLVIKLYDRFFKVLEFVLNKKATITCIGVKIEECLKIAKNYGFSLIHERSIMQGKEELKLYKFEFIKEDE